MTKMQETDGENYQKNCKQNLRNVLQAVKRTIQNIVAEYLGVSRNIITKLCKKERDGGYKSLEGDKRVLPKGIKGKLGISKKRN